MTLVYHPDKMAPEELTEQKKEMWLKIQDAYETLNDPNKRRKYDSSLPFDDSIPEEGDWSDEAGYFEMFNKVFKRNARWSKKKNVPDFMIASLSLEEIKKFFRFWDNFDSWRVFSQYDEYDVNEA